MKAILFSISYLFLRVGDNSLWLMFLLFVKLTGNKTLYLVSCIGRFIPSYQHFNVLLWGGGRGCKKVELFVLLVKC